MENKVYQQNITPEELNKISIDRFNGRVLVIDSMYTFKKYFKLLEGKSILGFDTETKPSFRKGKRNRVSLLQLAFNNTAFLFRLNKIGLQDELVHLLSDPKVIKTGVALREDINALQKLTRFEPAGFIDLQMLVRDFGIESTSLKKITAIVMGFRISKSQQVTDWEAPVLSEAQKIYAATDAWVCYQIYSRLTGQF